MLLLAGVGSSMLTGCVFRRMTVRTNPPGALVLVDGEEIGFTPVSTDFVYYGTREIKLIKPGYRTETILQQVRAPWYQVFPLDFFSDNFVPFKITNRHSFHYNLEPEVVVPQRNLIDRANGLRSQAHIGP